MIVKGIREKTQEAAKVSIEKKKALLIKAFEKYLTVTKVCSVTRIPRNTFYRYLREDPEFKASIDECTEIFLDEAETCLRQSMNTGNVIAAMFLLRTKGKHRGYVEKQEIDHTSEGKAIVPEVNIIFHNATDIEELKKSL